MILQNLSNPFVRIVRGHPLLLLFLLSPGIPEYLSGSSSWAVLLINPVVFFLFVLLNTGLYTMGVILVREAVLHWKKGWTSIFLLGVAYAIVEEGLALQTLFNPLAGPVGSLGFYGRWLGVNWVWSTGILLFHAVYSVGLPILLFRLFFPQLKGKSLVSLNRQKICALVMGIDCVVLFSIVKYWPGWEIMIGSFLAVLSLVFLAKHAPSGLFKGEMRLPKTRKRFVILGLLFFPAILLTEAILVAANAPALVTSAVVLVFALVLLGAVRHSIGTVENDRQKLALSLGLIVPVVCFGIAASIATGAILIFVADAGIVLFIRRLWLGYQSLPGENVFYS